MHTTPEHLLNEAYAFIAEGQHIEAGRRLEQAAEQLVGALRLEEAADALISAGRLYGMGGELAEAEALLSQVETLAKAQRRAGAWASALAELADIRRDSALQRARWRRAHALGDVTQKLHALSRLADEARSRQAHAEVAAYLSTAASVASEVGPLEHAEVLIELAIVRCVGGELQSAEALLQRAEGLAPEHPRLGARIWGQRAIIALAKGQDEAALRLATRAQRLASEDVSLFLASAQLIVLIHQKAGRELEAWEALQQARDHLRALQGEPGAALVEPAMQLFQERLGAQQMMTLQRARRVRQPTH